MSFRFLFNFLTDYAQPIRRLVGNAGQQGDAIVCGGIENGGVCRRNPSGRGNAVRPYTEQSAVGNYIAHLYVFQRTEIRPRASVMAAESYIAVPDRSAVYMAGTFPHTFVCCAGIDIREQLAIADRYRTEMTVCDGELRLSRITAAFRA